MEQDFRRLLSYIEGNQSVEAYRFMSELASSLRQELHASLIDTYLLNIFDETYGLLFFINHTVNQKPFTDAVAEALEIICTLVNNRPKELSKHTPKIRESCIKAISSSITEVKVKRRAFDLLKLVLEKTNFFLNDDPYEPDTIFEKLRMRLENSKGTVLASCASVLGVLIKKYPFVIKDRTIFRTLLYKLEQVIKGPSDDEIAGYFNCISDILEQFTDFDLKHLYRCIKQLMEKRLQFRKTGPRACLALLIKHTELFTEELYVDMWWWNQMLSVWLAMKGEDCKAGYAALDAITQKVSKRFTITNSPEDAALCSRIVSGFVDDINNPSLFGFKLRLAIRGLGFFTEAAKIHLSPSEITVLFIDMIHKIEKTYLIDNPDPDQLENLPDYVQTLSNILKQLENLSDYEIGVLQQAMILMIKLFPHLSLMDHNLVIHAVLISLIHLKRCKNEVFSHFLQNIVKQGVIWTCSHSPVAFAELQQDNSNAITYKKFLPFWQSLLRKPDFLYAEKIGVDHQVLKYVTEKIFQELMLTLFVLTHKLNLNTQVIENTYVFTDPEKTLEAVKANDFDIFINLVDLYVDLLRNVDKVTFKKCIPMYMSHNIAKSNKYPLVSGFYKLLAVGLEICNNVNYFDAQESDDVKTCYNSVCLFIQNMISKIKQYKGDLQISCIHVLLKAPVEIIRDILPNVSSIFKTLLALGRSNLKLVETGVSTLEFWYQNIPSEELEPFLKEILPSLDSFLISKSLGENFDLQPVKTLKTKQILKRRKIVTLTEKELFNLQKRIMVFISNLNNDLCASLVETDNIVEPTTWSKEPHLKISLAYSDINLNIYLDNFIPRIVELALHCSERSVRINACEVLHSAVILILGTSSSMNETKAKDFDTLLKKITYPLLQLGSDVDQTVQEIFRPLVIQLMHWYSSPQQKFSLHTAIIIETLMDGVAQSTDCAVRDFTCTCIHEFIKWTIKQTTVDSLEQEPINVKIFARKIKHFSLHTDPSKRLAAALIFNNIYTILREESFIFNAFWLEMLHSFVLNMSLIDEQDQYGCLNQVQQCLAHLERGFVEKSANFNKANRNRRIPLGFEGEKLKDVAEWLLKQTGSINSHCREQCIKLFLRIAPLVDKAKNTVQGYVKAHQPFSDTHWISDLYDHQIRNYREFGNSDPTYESLTRWLTSLLCGLDGHIFVLENNIAPSDYNLYKSEFYLALNYFFEKINSSKFNKFKTIERQHFDKLNEEIIRKAVKFVITLLKLNKDNVIFSPDLERFLQGYGWNIICGFIFEQTDLMDDSNHENAVVDLTINLNKHCSNQKILEFSAVLNSYIANKYKIPASLKMNVTVEQRHLIEGLLILKKSILSTQLDISMYTKGVVNDIFENLIECHDGQLSVINLNDSVKQYCESRLRFALDNNEEFSHLLQYLCDERLIKYSKTNELIRYGVYIFLDFKEVLVSFILANWLPFFDYVLPTSTPLQTHNFINEILRYIDAHRKNFDDTSVRNIIDGIFARWNLLRQYFDESVDQRIKGLEMLEKISCLLNENIKTTLVIDHVYNWIIEVLSFEDATWSFQYALTYVTHIINVLPLFMGYEEDDKVELEVTLNSVQEKYFKDIPQAAKVAVAITITKSFDAAIISKSKILFKFASVLYALVDLNASSFDVDSTCKVCMTKLNKEQQEELLHSMYDLCISLAENSPNNCYAITRDILINLIRNSAPSAYEQFYIKTIKQIINDINLSNESAENITKKTVAYVLIKILFLRIDVDRMHNKACPISKAAYPDMKDGKELTRNITKIASAALKENMIDVPEDLKEHFRIYMCHCYNALVCIISNTQKNVAFYKMLFSRDVNGENLLWRNLIGASTDYTFQMDFDKLPTETKALVSIRSTRQAERKRMNQSQTVHYLESQYLFNSTLSEDVQQYDFTRSVIRSQPLVSDESEDLESSIEMVIDVDSTEISSHECMATVCGLIQHMVDEITPTTEGIPALPEWMGIIKKELSNPNAPRNVKLFLVKAIETMQDIFKPYTKDFYNEVIQLILDGHAGNNINYFIADLVSMLISWSEYAHSVEESDAASKLLLFLMSNINSDRADIMKFHLELLKAFIEPWKDRVTIPKDYILSKISASKNSKKLDVIVHICAILLANNLPPWNANQIKDFVKCLCKTLDTEYLSVYRPCAAVIGMALNYVASNSEFKVHLNSFESFIVSKLKNFKDNNKSLNSLQEIIKYYPRIVDKFISIYIYKFKGLANDFKVICFKIFLEGIDTLLDSDEFHTLELNDFILEYNSIEAQILGLKIIQQMIPKLPPKKLTILDNICKFVSSTNHTCRSVMYDILMAVYDIYSNKNQVEYSEIVNKCRDVLLQGLVDNNSEIENKLKAFWLNEKNLPKNLFERFTFILKNMYKPSTEKDFLGYFIYFLLDDLTHSETFLEKLFDYQLSDCTFRNYNINNNWRTRHLSIAPMFASTFKSLDSGSSMADDIEPGYLRATQTLMEFEPTLKSVKEEFDNYTNNFLNDTDDESKPNAADAVFKKPYPVSDKSRLRRRRFYRDQSKISRGFAFREVERSSKAEEHRKDLAKQREQSVRLYRQYTIGDFPDISIKLSDVIIPLQELAKVDTHIARQFYITLFRAIFKKSVSYGNEADFVNETVTAINNIFSNSVQFIPNVMGAFLDVALTYKDKLLFQPETLSKLSQYSGLISTGSLLLEEYLISNDDSTTVEKKGRGHSSDPQVKCWVKLAELYKELNEWDIVRSIFLEKMNCSETILKAIDAESQGFWKDAQHFYSVVVGEDESLDRRDFYYESYYKCFAELSDWENLSNSIKSTVTESDEGDPWKELWDQDWNQQKLLPWYITAELRNSLEDDQRKQVLLKNFNEAMTDEVKYEYIKANFCEEIAFLWLLQNNTDKAMHYLNIYIQNFLNHWSNLNPLLVSLRTNKLINMKNAISIYSFINKLELINENNFEDSILNLCGNWLKFFKENLSSIISSETKTMYRNQFVNILENKVSTEITAKDFRITHERLNDAKFDLDMNLTELAIKLKNFHVAKKYLTKHGDYLNTEMDSIKHVTCNLAYCRLLYVKALHMPKPEEQLTYFIEAWSSADKCLQHDLLRSNKTFLLSTQLLVFNLTQSIYNKCPSDVDICQFENIETLCNDTKINGTADIARHGFLKLQQILDEVNNQEHKQELHKLIGEAYLQLAYFAYNDRESYTSELICFILKAMYFGSSEARQIFPCLLSIDNLGTEYKDIFVEHSKTLPEWMFIEWIPQLLANMDSQYVFAIQNIVTRIARTYPQAIMYAYRLSKEKYSIGEDEVGRCCQEVITILDELLLNDPLVDKLLHALSSVSSATNILSYYLKKLVKACNENSTKKFDDAVNSIKSVKESASNYSDIESMHGAVFKTLSTYLDKLLKISSYKKFEPVKIKNALRVINADIENLRKEKSKYKNRLSFYSPWLEHFSERELNLDLEIPGQYRGDRKPLLQYHVKISGFSSEVVEFHSLRRPIKLTFIGSDAKEYPYIVKFGEDLRQDQRVEQMFVLINTILKNDSVCHEKRLKIRTYQVIPLTSTLGIIEYVGNTKSLGEFVRESAAGSEAMFIEAEQGFVKKYLCSSASEINKKGEKEIYDRAVLKQSCDKTIAAYRGLVNCIPWDILRKAIWNVSVSPESFIALRHKFITTHAVNCISNWVLGIGDRHLDNSLVSLDSGEIIDIDFGHAFGSAVQLLPMPELVPFRLTPHILNLMQPFNEHGLIKETMVHIMRSLRKNAPSLLATMSVFIKEPSVEWLEFMSTSDNFGQARWCPETKISQAKLKLEGANPAVVMIEELRARTIDNSTIIEKYVSYVRGNEKDNIRARKADASLSIEDQVKCLLDHATDYNLLGRMYAGWRAWM